jgi:SAM-dependent methyltransferase
MAEMWDSVAPDWEANVESIDQPLVGATEVLLDAAGVGEGSTVLELAAGPAGAGVAAAERVGAAGSVLISDVAPEMVAIAQRRTASLVNVTTAVFDQTSIPGAADRFDAVIIRNGLMFMEEPAGAVAEAVRVLRPGGRYATLVWDRRERNPWLGLLLDAVGEQFGTSFPPPGVPGPFSLEDRGVLALTLAQGGLVDVRVQAVATPMQAQSLPEWWDRVPKLAGPLAQALAAMRPDVREQIRTRAISLAAAPATAFGDQIVFPGSVLIASGEKPSQPIG